MSNKNSWSVLFEGNNNIISYSFTKDINSNIYVCGTTDTNVITIDKIEYKANTETSCGFITKITKDGKVEWFQFIAGVLLQAAYSITIDANNNTYITGISNQNIIIDTTEYNNDDKTASGFLIKFNTNGKVEWVKWINGSNIDYGYSTAVDSNNNIYVVGASISPSINNNIPTRGLKTTTSTTTNAADTSSSTTTTATNADADASSSASSTTTTAIEPLDCAGFIIKFDIDGNILWFKWIDGSNYDIAYAVAIDSRDNIYVGGSSKSSAIKIDDNEYSRINENDIESVYLFKLNTEGIVEWFTWIAGNYIDIVSKVIIDMNDYIYLSGYSFSDYITINNNNYKRNNSYTSGAFIVKFNNNQIEWFNWVEGDKDIFTYSMATDKVGNVYFNGSTDSNYILANNYKYDNKNSNTNTFLIKYTNKGKLEWTTWLYNEKVNSSQCVITDLLIDNDYNIFFNIYTNFNILTFNNEKITVSNNTSPALNTFILKYNINDFNFTNNSLFLFIITNKYKVYKYLFNMLLFIIFIYCIWVIYNNTRIYEEVKFS